jgi:hypothetical protein
MCSATPSRTRPLRTCAPIARSPQGRSASCNWVRRRSPRKYRDRPSVASMSQAATTRMSLGLVAAELGVHQPDRVVGARAIMLNPLDERASAIADPDDRDVDSAASGKASGAPFGEHVAMKLSLRGAGGVNAGCSALAQVRSDRSSTRRNRRRRCGSNAGLVWCGAMPEMLGREAEGDGDVEVGERLHLPVEPVERAGPEAVGPAQPGADPRVPSRFIHATASSSRGS